MVEHRRSIDRLLRVAQGSAIIEGMAAMAVVFLLLIVLAQGAFFLVARSSASAAAGAAARRAALPGADIALETERLAGDVRATVPGASEVVALVGIDAGIVETTVRFRWAPPGPDLAPIVVSVASHAPQVVPP